MWKRASAELRGESNVVGYDLMVEPVLEPERVKGPDGVEDPEENAKRYRLWYDLAREIAGAIRDGGDETPILIGGAKGSPACALQCLPPLNLPHIVYTVHQYKPYEYTHQAWQKSDYNCGDLSDASPHPRRIARPRRVKEQLESIYGLLQGFRRANGMAPVAVNEFGVYRWAPDAAKHLKEEMRVIERVGANHALWLWEPQTTCVGYDAFNYLHGRDFSKHRPDLENSLLKAIKEIWRSNTAFPNNVTFRSGQRRSSAPQRSSLMRKRSAGLTQAVHR